MLPPEFIAGVLEGIEGTLGEVADLTADCRLRERLEALADDVAQVRTAISRGASEAAD
jgi:hypothetical protein